MAIVSFDVNSQSLFEKAINATPSAMKEAVEEGAELLKKFTKQTGSSMLSGPYATGETLRNIEVKGAKKHGNGYASYVTYNGRNKKGNRNAEVAFLNEYGVKRAQSARPFNETAIQRGGDAISQKMDDVLDKIWKG